METNKTRKTGMARLIEITMMHKVLIICSMLLAVVAALAGFVPYIAIYQIVKEILEVYPNIETADSAQLLQYGAWAVSGVLGNVVLYFLALMCSHLAAFGTLYELKVNFASHLAKLPLGVHMILGSGRLRKIMDENIEKVEGFIAHQVPDITAALVSPIAAIVILMAVDWRFGLATIVGIAISFVVQASMYGKETSRGMMAKYQATLEIMNNASVEYVRGIAVVKAFKQTVHSFQRLMDAINEYTEVVIQYTLSWEFGMSAFTSLINHLYMFLIPVGILVGMTTEQTAYLEFASSFAFYLIFVPSIASVLMKTMYVVSDSVRIIGGVEKMDAILDKETLAQPENAKEINTYDIKFENVSFAYEAAGENLAVSNVDFVAQQGEITAIVGPSGGGKTTIAHLIPRFFDVKEGAIKIGGADIREMRSEYLMNQVAFVFQDVFLFKQSVRDNICMGNAQATWEQILEASKAAQCHDFIMQLPNGYDTVIGTAGVHLSGGERQRLAIARAIVKDAPVIILDEATAFSDPENEHLIQKAFETLLKGKTVVMIAHRLSTIRSADKIIVMEHGHVIEEGNHGKLIEKNGKYKHMWDVYTQSASWKMNRKGVNVNA